MFDWIGNLIEWVVQIFPRIIVVRTTHRVVKFVRGKNVKLVEPGICWYWPILTEYVMIPVARQTVNLPTQRLVTSDGKRVVTSAVVVYTISDAVQAVGKSWDYDETIRDISMAEIASIITGWEYEQLLNGLGDEVRKDLTSSCRSALIKYGVRVNRCLLTDFCPASVIAHSHIGGIPMESE
jgi:regulator of protease activity HflC (stomatin/prohibitin superfamily)